MSNRSSRRQKEKGPDEKRSERTRDRRGGEDAAEKPAGKNRLLIAGGIAAGVLLLGILIFGGTVRRSMLFSSLQSAQNGTREEAINGLVAFGDSVRPRLASIVEGKDPGKWSDASKQDAARGLMLLKNAPADEAIKQFAVVGEAKPSEEQTKIRLWALNAIAGTPGTASRFQSDLWLANAGSADPKLRETVAKGLKAYKESKVVTALIALMSDPETKVIEAATSSLAEVATAKDAPQLVGLLEKEEPYRSKGKNLLLLLAGPEAVEALGKLLDNANETLAVEILDLFQSMDKPPDQTGVDVQVAKATESRSVTIQCKALEVAGKLKLKATYGKIATAAKSDTPEVRLAAVKAAAMCGNPDLAKKVRPLIQDSDSAVRLAVIAAIVAARDDSALADLVEALNHEDDKTKKAAAKALGEFFSGRAKKCGLNANEWKKWWKVYQEQLAFVEEIEKTRDEVEKLVAEGNEGLKKALALIKDTLPRVEGFLADSAVLTEIKNEGRPERIRLDAAKARLELRKHKAMKDQTVDADGGGKPRAKPQESE